MPVYQLTEALGFPNPELADEQGLLAIGGDLSEERLILAYSMGIYPWFTEGDPILWWSPDPRMVLFPDRLKVSKSLSQSIRNKGFTVSFDTRFEEVIHECALINRKEQSGTWITPQMIKAYIKLFGLGLAHSVEVFQEDKLVGGLYGVSLGHCFFGESMFHKKSDASKVALFHLVSKITSFNFHFIDAQMDTTHLGSLGGELIPRNDFLNLLRLALNFPTIRGKW